MAKARRLTDEEADGNELSELNDEKLTKSQTFR